MLDTMLGRPLEKWGVRLGLAPWELPCLLLEVSALCWMATAVSRAAAGLMQVPWLDAVWTATAVAWVLGMRGDVRTLLMERISPLPMQRLNNARGIFGFIACLDGLMALMNPSAHGVLSLCASMSAATALSTATLDNRNDPSASGPTPG